VANETAGTPSAVSGAARLRITWIKSDIGHKYDQKTTIKSLGFHRLNESIEQEDSPTLRGMISKVKHLVKVEIV
jgi:large subunit ribosomal protein L30